MLIGIDLDDGRAKEVFRQGQKHLYGRSAPGCFVARSVRRNDYINDPVAMKAYWKEWGNLEKRRVWN